MAPAVPSPRDAFAAYCAELLGAAVTVRVRRMFGGHGLYLDGLFVGLVADERLYLKVVDDTRAAFAAAGCTPFVYDAGTKPVTMSFWSVPDDAMDRPAAMAPWARLALQAARHAAAKRPPKLASGAGAPARARRAATPTTRRSR